MRLDELPVGAEGLADLPEGSEIVQVGSISIERWGDIAEAFRSEPAGPIEIRTESPVAVVEIDLPADSEGRARIAGSLTGSTPRRNTTFLSRSSRISTFQGSWTS